MANYNIALEDNDNCISRLDYEIDYMDEIIEQKHREWNIEYSTSATSQNEKIIFLNNLQDLEKGIEVLKVIRNVIAQAQENIDNHVEFKSDSEKFIYNEEEADSAMDKLQILLNNDICGNPTKFNFPAEDITFTPGYEDFCGSMKDQKNWVFVLN